MDCVLMHKNIPVVDMSIKDRTAMGGPVVDVLIDDRNIYYIAELRDVYDIRHLPPGV